MGLCLGQSKAPTQPAQDLGAKQNYETSPNSEGRLFVPSAPKTDFEATLQQLLKEGKLKPGKVMDFRDDSHGEAFPSVILPSYCFTMRTYTFSRQADGSAPKLKGVSTCTQGNNYQLREAKPDVRIYPSQ
jgi:hypothetical protein